MNPNLKKRIESINKGIIPEGYKKTKVGIVPVEWEIEKLSEIGKNYIGLTYTPEDTANTGLIVLRSSNIKDSKIDLNDCVFVKCEVSEKNRVKTNDILICARNGSSSLIGKSALITEAYSNLAFGAFMSVYRTKYYNYIFQAFQSFIIKKQILRNLGARINQITTADINQFKVPFPPLPEQQKIAEILSTQDKLIELQARKIEQLQALKKACLQRMFPKKGCDRPEIRFPEFTDAWEQRKLGECVTITSGEAPSKFKHGSVNYVKVDDLNYAYKTVVDTQNKVSDNPSMSKVKVGSVIFPKRGAAILTNKVRILGVESYMDTNMMALTATSFDSDFLYVLISKEGLYKIADTSTIPQINNKHIEPYEVIVPTLDEQKCIGELFAHLDHLITLHQRKLDEEKQKKKALMQLLLTGIVRVKI